MPNRRTPPKIYLPPATHLPKARRWTLHNGLEVVAIGGAKAPIIRLELIFDAGRPYEQQRLVARAANQLITEGTQSKSAAELESFFEYYGTSLRTPNHFDTSHLVVFTILSHLPHILPILAEVVAAPAFTEADFAIFVKRSRQALREDLSDPDTIAYRHFTEYVFGSHHPYGYNGMLADYNTLALADVQAHHQRTYGAANAKLLLAGQIDSTVEALIDRYLGQLPSGQAQEAEQWQEQSQPPHLLQLRRPKAQQTLIRQGGQLFRRDHPDYPGMTVLNTILGGFFGSRLMRNIREDKGYTYGIDSSIDFMRHGGFLTIAADVANENLAKVRQEIALEIEKLQQDLVSTAELDLVRAYLLGNLLAEVDGPMNIAERYQTILIEQSQTEHFDRLIEEVHSIDAQRLQQLAQTYLRPEALWEVVVGGAKTLEGAKPLEKAP